MTSEFDEFNDFDKTFDKENNTFETYAEHARQFIYFRNLETIFYQSELEKLFYVDYSFSWEDPYVEIGYGSIFNMLFNAMNQYFNPNAIFTKDNMKPILNNELPCHLHITEFKDGGLFYSYNFIIGGI